MRMRTTSLRQRVTGTTARCRRDQREDVVLLLDARPPCVSTLLSEKMPLLETKPGTNFRLLIADGERHYAEGIAAKDVEHVRVPLFLSCLCGQRLIGAAQVRTMMPLRASVATADDLLGRGDDPQHEADCR